METLPNTIEVLANAGIFGPGTFKSTTITKLENVLQFSSNILKGSVTLKLDYLDTNTEETELEKDYHLFFKFQHDSEVYRNLSRTEQIFAAEIAAYKKLIPWIKGGKLDLFPKFYYGISTNGVDITKDVCIIQDLTSDGYKLCDNIFMDYNHIVLAVTKLAEFHALSYTAKFENPVNFFKYIKELPKVKFYIETSENFFRSILYFALDVSMKKNTGVEVLNKIKNKLKKLTKVVKYLFDPDDKFSVLCHGDFHNKNILYKCNHLNLPIGIKFIDLQTITCTTPIYDLALLLYMNTDNQLREKYWNEFLNIYWETLYVNCPEIGFTYEEFLKHFEEKAIIALFPISLFLPILLSNDYKIAEKFSKYNSPDLVSKHLIDVFKSKDQIELFNVVNDMYKQNYFQKFLQIYPY